MKKTLFACLREYSESGVYPFHMPGHKRNGAAGALSDLYRYDITEIDGFDDLHHPEGIIKSAQQRAAALYHSKETFFLINGSTSGILSAISAVAKGRRKLVIARNCHKSVYHGAFLNHLETEYIFPPELAEFGIAGGISAGQVKDKLAEIARREKCSLSRLSDIVGAVVITSPSYEGILSDVEGIVREAHCFGIPVIVDQAHGAHFGFHPEFPQSAVAQGADLVIHSVHKTLPAPTQTALLHRNGHLTDGELLRRYLRIYQSSSPSYLLMAGIDEAMAYMEKEGERGLSELLFRRRAFDKEVKGLRLIRLYPWEQRQEQGCVQEPGKLLISVRGASLTGKQLHELLRTNYGLQMEMYGEDYVLAILTAADREEGYGRLSKALLEIDGALLEGNPKENPGKEIKEGEGGGRAFTLSPSAVLSLEQAFLAPWEALPLEEAKGRIAGDFVNFYPPGIPVLVPGEEITEQILHMLSHHLKKGFQIQGIDEEHRLKVLRRMEESL